MTKDVKPSRRQRQAAETQLEILGAARRLFAEQGYGATLLTDIAREAGVAVQTIYASLGSKKAIVMAMVDLVDREAGVGAIAARIQSSKKPAEILEDGVLITRLLNERCGDILSGLRSAAAVEPDAAAAWAEGQRRHRAGRKVIARRLAALGAIRSGVTEEEAAVVIGILTSFDSWTTLVIDHHWSFDRSQSWIVSTLKRMLFK